MRHIRRDGKLPEWQIGLIIAVLLTVAGYVALKLLGAGDDPTFTGVLGAFI